MCTYSLSHLSDRALLRDLAALVAHDRATTAALLAHIAEVDSRQLYLPAAYPSMYAYCVHELRLSEEAAFKRIHAARTARRFPAIFGALAEGRLHLRYRLLRQVFSHDGTSTVRRIGTNGCRRRATLWTAPSSLCMQATSATLGSLPRARRRS